MRVCSLQFCSKSKACSGGNHYSHFAYKGRQTSPRARTLGTDAVYWLVIGDQYLTIWEFSVMPVKAVTRGRFRTVSSGELNSSLVVYVRVDILCLETCYFSTQCFTIQPTVVRKSVPGMYSFKSISPHLSRSNHRGQMQFWI